MVLASSIFADFPSGFFCRAHYKLDYLGDSSVPALSIYGVGISLRFIICRAEYSRRNALLILSVFFPEITGSIIMISVSFPHHPSYFKWAPLSARCFSTLLDTPPLELLFPCGAIMTALLLAGRYFFLVPFSGLLL